MIIKDLKNFSQNIRKVLFLIYTILKIHYDFNIIFIQEPSWTILWSIPSFKIFISQTPKHVRDMFNFNTTSNPCGYLVLFVSKTPSVVWYFIMDLILPKVCGYFALFESKSVVIFICIHCLIISLKLRKFTWILCGVFPSPNLNSYIVFH